MFLPLALAAASIAASPVIVTVHAAPNISPLLVKAALEEAAAVWRSGGITLVWHAEQDESTAVSAAADRRWTPIGSAVRVFFDDGPNTVKDNAGTIGWIVFNEFDMPLPDIHLSHANAVEIMRGTYTDGRIGQMTIAERRTCLSRALGRALAHELGHYLFGSKQHTPGGLMKGRQTAGDLFGPARKVFDLTREQRSDALARLGAAERLAQR